ncbi:MAG TPA: replication-relaxation family protein [Candidatus Hodarchaeales archaeon]|nr:replication-relaxation family protein [Candidatus Hodarchaeales archaeon]
METNIYISPQEAQIGAERLPRLPIYTRAENAPSMRLTERDRAILEAIHAFDGMLADYQIQRLFFQGRRQMQHRMSLLFHHGYVSRPDRKKRAAITNMVYWLGKKGANYVAGLSGQNLNEFKYRKEPKWFTLDHDIAVNDFRLQLLKACKSCGDCQLEYWMPEGEFWANPDRVEYKLPNGKRKSRYIRPDGCFSIINQGYRNRFLLEIDMATEDNPRFTREKILPGLAYLKSKPYRERFGRDGYGRWLVVTTGEKRMQNMISQANQVTEPGAVVFYFSTFDRLNNVNFLHEPIWLRGDSEEPQSLIV